MKQARSISRRFPDYGWAWPTGSLDQLLKAAMLSDENEAERIALSWLDDHDINDVSFADHRLLAAITDRFGKRLASHPSFPRLAGLQKMLWTRSRMTFREARLVLAALAEAGCPVMLLKGASRVAICPDDQRGRVSHDVDILVRPDRMADALDILLAAGWKASTGVGPLYLKEIISSVRGLNFYKGEYGDLDLHQSAFRPFHGNAEEDEALWRRAVEARLEGVPVLVPSPADRISLAISHSGLEAHVHSDWLTDIDNTVRKHDVDWDVFLRTAETRGLAVPAAISLGYLKRVIGTPLPEDVLAELLERADRAGIVSRASVLEAKPRRDFGRLSAVGRGILKQLRLFGTRPAKRVRNEEIWRARSRRMDVERNRAGQVTSCSFRLPPGIEDKTSASIEITIDIDTLGRARRFEFELSTPQRHLARLRYRSLFGRRGLRRLRFKGDVELFTDDEALFLEARPSRHFRNWDNAEDVSCYGAVPFVLDLARLRVSGETFRLNAADA